MVNSRLLHSLMKRSDALSLDEIISRMMDSAGMTDRLDLHRACYLWAEVVGPHINSFTTRRWVEGTTLHVAITSASLKEELSYLRPQLAARINELLGREIITDIMIH